MTASPKRFFSEQGALDHASLVGQCAQYEQMPGNHTQLLTLRSSAMYSSQRGFCALKCSSLRSFGGHIPRSLGKLSKSARVRSADRQTGVLLAGQGIPACVQTTDTRQASVSLERYTSTRSANIVEALLLTQMASDSHRHMHERCLDKKIVAKVT